MLPQDRDGRSGRRHVIEAAEVPTLERYLGVAFRGQEERTTATVKGEGDPYRCREIARRGEGPGCVDITARDDIEALVKCSLVANNRRWFGGVAEPGKCSASRRLLDRMAALIPRGRR